jgi:hypothetical protein
MGQGESSLSLLFLLSSVHANCRFGSKSVTAGVSHACHDL